MSPRRGWDLVPAGGRLSTHRNPLHQLFNPVQDHVDPFRARSLIIHGGAVGNDPSDEDAAVGRDVPRWLFHDQRQLQEFLRGAECKSGLGLNVHPRQTSKVLEVESAAITRPAGRIAKPGDT